MVPCQRFPLARQAVGERLVDDDDPAGPSQREQGVARVRDGRRVGRVADEDQVRVVRHQAGVEREREREDHPVDLVPGRAQRRLRLGELRVHDDRAPWPQDPREQHEGLGRAGGEQHLGRRAGVAGRHRGDRLPLVRVGREVGAADALGQPARCPARADVDREVDQAGTRSASP